MKRVVITAGGSGGHLLPAQTVANELHREGIEVSFIGAGLGGNRFFDKRWSYEEICSASPSLRSCAHSLYRIGLGTVQAFSSLRKQKCDLMIGFGSYHTAPALAAAVLRKIPLVLYEANAVPGRVTRLFSGFSLWTGCFFQEASSWFRRSHLVAHPLRSSFYERPSRSQARAYFGLSFTRRVLLVIGGSQGSSFINQWVPQAVAQLHPQPAVIHLVGRHEDLRVVEETYAQISIPAVVRVFEPMMSFAFSAADMVICRAGASTIAEIEAYQLPAVYIPLLYAKDHHQKKNALAATKRGRATMLEEKEMNTESLVAMIHAVERIERDTLHIERENITSLILQTLNRD